MKRVFILLAALSLVAMANAQTKTMYVMKNGKVEYQSVVSDIDSIIFYKPTAGMVDGEYVNTTHNTYTIVVQGDTWISKINGVNYGKGTYTINGNSVVGQSTHAWQSGAWYPYTGDTFTGTYNESSNSFTITTTGYDGNFNGTYSRVEPNLKETTYTFEFNAETGDIAIEAIIYEYDVNNTIVGQRNISCFYGQKQVVTVNPKATKVKVKTIWDGLFTIWVEEIYYLEAGKNIVIKIADETKMGFDEPQFFKSHSGNSFIHFINEIRMR